MKIKPFRGIRPPRELVEQVSSRPYDVLNSEEARAEAEAIRDQIKAEMLSRDTEELEAGRFIVRWTSVLSSRFDTTSFKKEHAEMYRAYTRQSSSRRFTVA